jgi:hypothetical protein
MVAFAVGDMIPMLDDNGSGQYIKGRNNAKDIRDGLIGAVGLTGSDSFNPRVGVFPDFPSALMVQAQSTPDQTVAINPGRAIITRSGQGGYLLTSGAPQNLAMPAASAVNPRYDIVCIAAYDKGPFAGDASHGPEFVVVSGTPAGSPAVPATPTDMLKLADVFRGTNDNTIALSDITDKRVSTVIGGQIRTFFGGDAGGGTGRPGEIRLNAGNLEIADTTGTWQTFGVPLGSLTPRGLIAAPTAVLDGTAVTTSEVIAPEKITGNVVSGRRYRITHTRNEALAGGATVMTARYRVAAGGTVTTSGTLIQSRVTDLQGFFRTITFVDYWVATFTGQATFGVGCLVNGGGSGTMDVARARVLAVEDVT